MMNEEEGKVVVHVVLTGEACEKWNELKRNLMFEQNSNLFRHILSQYYYKIYKKEIMENGTG